MNLEPNTSRLISLAIILTVIFVTVASIELFKLQKTYNDRKERYLFAMQEELARCNPGAHFIVSGRDITGCVVGNTTYKILGGYWTDKDKLEVCGCDKI